VILSVFSAKVNAALFFEIAQEGKIDRAPNPFFAKKVRLRAHHQCVKAAVDKVQENLFRASSPQGLDDLQAELSTDPLRPFPRVLEVYVSKHQYVDAIREETSYPLLKPRFVVLGHGLLLEKGQAYCVGLRPNELGLDPVEAHTPVLLRDEVRQMSNGIPLADGCVASKAAVLAATPCNYTSSLWMLHDKPGLPYDGVPRTLAMKATGGP
jgi:hypothetical protein